MVEPEMAPTAAMPTPGTTLLMATLLSLLEPVELFLATTLNHSVLPAVRPVARKVVVVRLLPINTQSPVVVFNLEMSYWVAPVTPFQLKFSSPPAQEAAVVVSAVGVPKMLKLASLTSVKAPLLTLISALEVLVPAGGVHAKRVVLGEIVVLSVVQSIPLFKEYSSVGVNHFKVGLLYFPGNGILLWTNWYGSAGNL